VSGASKLEAHADSEAGFDGERVAYQMVSTAPPLDPADVDSAESAVEVLIMWGAFSILHVEHLSPPRSFYVGDATDAKGKSTTDYLIGSESIGGSRVPIAVESGAGVAAVIPRGATGSVTFNGERIGFEELAAQGLLHACSELAGATQYPLPAGATARVEYGGFTFVITPTAAARRVGTVGASQPRWQDSAWVFASLAFNAALLVLFYVLPPKSSTLSLDLLSADSRLSRYLIVPPVPPEDDPLPEWIDKANSKDAEGGTGKRAEGDEGQMGKQEAQKTNKRFAIKGPPDNQNPEMAREQAKEMAANAGIIGTLRRAVGAWNSPTSVHGADAANGADPIAALGALMGDPIGANFGFGGLGPNGHGHGGGGTAEGAVGVGDIDTVGRGAHGGNGFRYGERVGSLGDHHPKVPRIRGKEAVVSGSLSKEVIRRVIGRHINEVKFCYEQGLTQRPDLQGRISIKFAIAPTGAVQFAGRAESTLENPKVDACIVQAVQRWNFPAPEGGGIVIVTYPFVLEQTNG
jgi:hypothetical protein